MIKKLSENYISQIADIEKEAFKNNAWSEINIKRELSNDNCTFILLVEGEIVIGYYSYYKSLDEAYINNIAVKNSYRGKGYGKLLLSDLIDSANKQNIKNITLEVRKSNIIAQKLYESMGFKFAGARPNFYDNNEDALIYWKVEE